METHRQILSISRKIDSQEKEIDSEGELQVEERQRGFSISQGDKDEDTEQQKVQRWAD